MKVKSLKAWVARFKEKALFKEWSYWLCLALTVGSGLYIISSICGIANSFPGKELVEALHAPSPVQHGPMPETPPSVNPAVPSETTSRGIAGDVVASETVSTSSTSRATAGASLPVNTPGPSAPPAKQDIQSEAKTLTSSGAEAEGKQSLEHKSPYICYLLRIPLGTWILGLFQIAVLPLGAGVLQWASPKGRKRKWANLVSFVMLFIYVIAFGLTYNMAVLLLAVVAWMLAAQHLDEIKVLATGAGKLSDETERLGDEIKDLSAVAGEAVEGLRAFGLARIDSFYKEFYNAIKGVDENDAALDVLSVEQQWTMDQDAWANFKGTGLSTSEAIGAWVEGIRGTSFYGAIVNSSAQRFLFIGLMPRRQRQGNSIDGYDLKDFDQLIALIFSMCVLELARRSQLEKYQNVRTQCVIADVPIWVKIVGNRYWHLHGSADTHYFIQRDEAQEGKTHAKNITLYRQTVESHARHARGAYEYVSALIVESAIILGLRKDAKIVNSMDKIINAIYGKENFQDYLDYLKLRDRVTVTSADVVHLFALFLGLYLSEPPTTAGEALNDTFNGATLAELWERSA